MALFKKRKQAIALQEPELNLEPKIAPDISPEVFQEPQPPVPSNNSPNQYDEEDNGGGYFPPSLPDERDEIGIIKELKPDDVLERIEMKLRGFKYNQLYKKWEKKREPLMNEVGINKYMTVLSAVSELVTLSRYKEEQVPPRVQFVCDQIIPTIHINYKEYGIKCKSDLSIIDVQLFSFTESALNKAIGGGDRSIIKGTVDEIINRRNINLDRGYPQEERGGMLSKINPFK